MASNLLSIFLAITLITPTLAVNVLLGGTRWHYKDYFGGTSAWFAGCTNLQPGECCLKPPGLIIDPGFTTFSFLSDLDIAFLWQARQLTQERQRTARGCSGLPFHSHMGGGGSWTYHWSNANPFVDGVPSARVAGASYLRLPPRLPPDEVESVWLGVEGLKGFVWGGGKWFAGAGGYANSGGGGGGGGGGKILPKRRDAKGKSNMTFPGPQISKNRSLFRGGKFVAKESEIGRWVDWVKINGTRFDLMEREDVNGTYLRYRNDKGAVVDLSSNGAN